jgi:hypothetical protein
VGDHIRPRVRVPDKWEWPVGVSLSTEIRPIIDKSWYVALNPPGDFASWARLETGSGFLSEFQSSLLGYAKTQCWTGILRRVWAIDTEHDDLELLGNRFLSQRI